MKFSDKPGLILLLQQGRAMPCAAEWRNNLDMADAGGKGETGSEQVEFSYNSFFFLMTLQKKQKYP